MLSFSPRSAIVVSFVRFRRAQQGHCAMRVRVLHAKLYAYALPGSTARQLVFSSSTLLDSSTARQNSTDLNRPRPPRRLPRRMQSASTCLDGIDSYSTATQQLLDRLDRQGLELDRTSTAGASTAGASTERLDGASTARQLESQGSSEGWCRRATLGVLLRGLGRPFG